LPFSFINFALLSFKDFAVLIAISDHSVIIGAIQNYTKIHQNMDLIVPKPIISETSGRINGNK